MVMQVRSSADGRTAVVGDAVGKWKRHEWVRCRILVCAQYCGTSACLTPASVGRSFTELAL